MSDMQNIVYIINLQYQLRCNKRIEHPTAIIGAMRLYILCVPAAAVVTSRSFPCNRVDLIPCRFVQL
jgi:hypothetical protein